MADVFQTATRVGSEIASPGKWHRRRLREGFLELEGCVLGECFDYVPGFEVVEPAGGDGHRTEVGAEEVTAEGASRVAVTRVVNREEEAVFDGLDHERCAQRNRESFLTGPTRTEVFERFGRWAAASREVKGRATSSAAVVSS